MVKVRSSLTFTLLHFYVFCENIRRVITKAGVTVKVKEEKKRCPPSRLCFSKLGRGKVWAPSLLPAASPDSVSQCRHFETAFDRWSLLFGRLNPSCRGSSFTLVVILCNLVVFFRWDALLGSPFLCLSFCDGDGLRLRTWFGWGVATDVQASSRTRSSLYWAWLDVNHATQLWALL